MIEHQPFKDIGERLVRIRTTFSGLSQTDWAEKHSFGRTQLKNWEQGVRRIPIEASIRLSKLYGLSLDWIYLDLRDALSGNALRALFGKN
jgi:transcriptional regulator with XRE-family HTH domain